MADAVPDQPTVSNAVVAALREVLTERAASVPATIDGSTRLLGRGAVLDSLGLVTLIVDLEDRLERDFKATLVHILERADFQSDLFVFANLSMDSLDYAGPKINEGSKGVLLGCGAKKRELPREFHGALPPEIRNVRVFAPGCLVVDVPTYADDAKAAARIAAHAAFSQWPLIVLSDDAARTAKSSMNFLWSTFTRFDPAADIHAAKTELVHNHASHTPPLAIDARMKPWYPEELACDETTSKLVDRRWNEYFPARKVAMGDSLAAHLD